MPTGLHGLYIWQVLNIQHVHTHTGLPEKQAQLLTLISLSSRTVVSIRGSTYTKFNKRHHQKPPSNFHGGGSSPLTYNWCKHLPMGSALPGTGPGYVSVFWYLERLILYLEFIVFFTLRWPEERFQNEEIPALGKSPCERTAPCLPKQDGGEKARRLRGSTKDPPRPNPAKQSPLEIWNLWRKLLNI